MNKIIVVGHGSVGLPEVEALLFKAGMRPALPSKRDGLLPSDVARILCEAHECAPLSDVTSEADLRPVQTGPMWNGLALDLVLGNLQQPLWGWADERNIFWLEYWRALDADATFLLVYDHPGTAIHKAANTLLDAKLDMELPRILENWEAYNGAMLRFFCSHPERCVLINAGRAKEQLQQYLEQLSGKLRGKARPLLKALPGIDGNTDANGNPDREDAALCPSLILALKQFSSESASDLIEWFDGGSRVDQYLLNQLLQAYPQALQMFQELESANSVTCVVDREAWHLQPRDIWVHLMQHRNALRSVVNALFEKFQALLNAERELRQQLADIRYQHHALGANKIEMQTKLEEENNLLLAQLHQVQEELESFYLKNEDSTRVNRELRQQLGAETQAREAEAMSMAELQQKLTAETKVRQKEAVARGELQKQLDATLEELRSNAANSAREKELAEENELLLVQLHQVQEELERYYLENQVLKKNQAKTAAKPHGAAERIRQGLAYRLGAVMVEHGRSLTGWPSMPFAIVGQVHAYRAHKKTLDGKKLPPVSSYADAHEAERVKQHLSYRLGQTLLRHHKTPWGWLVLPFAIRRTLSDFRKSRA